ncbi:hypothetical protein DN752_17985 [Echinicola strongylocentroti]|uniref:Uncharacterized protein n=1 Tax=Echinicola strongylocentroti TaxID=1795355 RepID=A0A2Z4IL86_9BACT|nr:hypothetical protein [Echinicola strongylocentroti]AWW31871.1 hypothetical protein DN752_17985 [Echinicola strongylocentroti]
MTLDKAKDLVAEQRYGQPWKNLYPAERMSIYTQVCETFASAKYEEGFEAGIQKEDDNGKGFALGMIVAMALGMFIGFIIK